ncbi:MAG: HAD hydrolase-like protein [Desulfobulbaceae bacterium]|nr:HAD hydrolase-like protein [Desulfobulbaceae bacterium]
MQTYYSLDTLIKAGKKKAAEKDVITFDLFDTLLIRRIHDPDLVKLPVARYIAALAEKAGRTISWQKVQSVRDRIEQRQRGETGQRFEDHEACYPVFMEETLRELFQECYDGALLQKVTDYELLMENSMLVPRHELVAWLRELSEAGKRVFIISDMYLPATHLEKLVEHGGFLDLVEGVVSSADSFLAKASGKGYQLVADRYGLEPASWLHVGDNAFSDGLRAEEFGIEPLIIHDPREDQRKSIVKRYYNYSDGKPFWRGRLLQQLMAPHEGENSKQDPLYVEGYNFFGPLIGVFVQQIAELCKTNGITKVFFLSREGWTFKRYWEQAIPQLYPAGGTPEIEYLYVSRMALAGASCAYQGLTKTNADIAFLPAGNRDFTDVCRIFSLDYNKFQSILENYELSIDTCLSHIHDGYDPENRKKFEAMLGDSAFQQEVRTQTKDSNSALQRYLEDVGFFDHTKVAIVDIGWLGSIQRFLFEAIAHREDVPKCIGYLFGATRGIPYPTDDKNSVTGVMYDRDRFDLAGSTLFYARDIFEEACRAPYPTLNGYRLDGDGYELVFRTTEDEIGQAELQQDSYFAPLQQGIFDSAARFGIASALLGYSFDDYKPWVNYTLVNKLAFPQAKEISRIKNQHHLDDFHGQKKPKADFGKGIVPLWECSQRQLRFNPFLRMRYFFSHLRERINE